MFSSLQSNFTSVLDTPEYPERAFRLRRALEKLTSLTCHVQYLVSCVTSPRLRSVLPYRIHISTVPGQTRAVQLPGSKEEWKSFLEVAAAKTLPSQENDAERLAAKFGRGTHMYPAHCECALIQYLATKHGNSWDNVPAFSYIGVSKPSCSACHRWLEAFNQVGRQKFFTRGSHGKWYWPWAMPVPKAEESLKETMAGNISHQYIRYLEENKLYGSGTDRTVRDASLSWGKHRLSDAQMESIHSRHALAVQESGGTIALHLDSMTDNW